MKKRYIPIFFLMIWLWGLTACRPVPISPTLTPAPTPDATRQLLAEELSPPGYSGLAAWGGMVYFGYGNAFYWLDVHDPAHPTLQGNLPLPNRLSRISLQDGEAHLILSTPDGFDSPVLADGWQRVDLTTPARRLVLWRWMGICWRYWIERKGSFFTRWQISLRRRNWPVFSYQRV